MRRSRQPPEPLQFFVDRSLGRHQLPDALVNVGRVVHTMLSVYGHGVEEQVADETWLAEAGQRGWLVLTKDARIRRRPAELDAVIRHCVRVICITNQGLTGGQQVDLIVNNIHRIEQRARTPGPWIYASTSAPSPDYGHPMDDSAPMSSHGVRWFNGSCASASRCERPTARRT